jgi:hypothetical protein
MEPISLPLAPELPSLLVLRTQCNEKDGRKGLPVPLLFCSFGPLLLYISDPG